MITLISLHNHTFSTNIAITVNQKVNCSLTRDMVTIYIKSHYIGVALTSWYFPCKKQEQNKKTVHWTCLRYFSLARTVLKHLVGETQNGSFWGAQSSKVETLHFQDKFSILLLFTQSQLSTTGDGKDVPFNSWAGIRSSQSHISNWRLL